MASKLLDFQVDANDIKRVHAKLARASGKPLYTRMQRANLAAGDLLARRVAAAAPRGPTGHLRRSIRARPEKRVSGSASPQLRSALRNSTAPRIVSSGSPASAILTLSRRELKKDFASAVELKRMIPTILFFFPAMFPSLKDSRSEICFK